VTDALSLADGASSPIDQGVSTMLFLAAFLFGLVAVQRLRGRGFPRLPRAAGWAAAGLAAGSLALAVLLPPLIRPVASTGRPSSTARLQILTPRSGEVFHGNPATVPVRFLLTGGTIVPFTSTKLVPNEGHIHLFLDGALVSMGYTLSKDLQVTSGQHTLQAEFVAADHRPFDPRILERVRFQVVG
jgi:hypothetical protein